MIKSILFCLFFCYSISGFSQENVLLKGKVRAGSLSGSSINIINLTQKTGTTNKASGEFQIEVREQDTLFFSSVQYEDVRITITPDILLEGYLQVELKESINELDEVKISNIGLTGNLGQDLSTIATFSQKDVGIPLSSKPRPTSIQRKLITASAVQKDSEKNPPGLANVSLDGILNTFNGKIEMLRKARENEVAESIVSKGIEAFPLELFLKELHLPENQIKNFVYFCAENPHFKTLLADEKRLELLEYYQKKAPQFLEQRMGK